MQAVKTYSKVNRMDESVDFKLVRMEENFLQLQGKPDVPHRHDFYTVLLVEHGVGEHRIDFDAFPLDSNQIFLVGPGQVHQLIEKEVSKGYALLFSTAFLAANNIALSRVEDLQLFNNYGGNDALRPDAESMKRIVGYAKRMEEYNSISMPNISAARASLLLLILLECYPLCTQPRDEQSLQAGNSILKDFKNLVETNFKSQHHVSFYADELHVTSDHLNRTVKHLLGKTAKEYIQARISVSARRMLHFTDLSVKQVALELGFGEPAHFNRFFKKCTGESPGEFRKRH